MAISISCSTWLRADMANRMDDGIGEDVEADSSSRGRGGRKKLILFVILPLLLLSGIASALYATGVVNTIISKISIDDPQEKTKPFFYEMSPILVNLNYGDGESNFLKLSIELKVESQEGRALIEAVMPRVIDSFLVYLRQLRIEDLEGAAGLHRLRQELLRRVNMVVDGVEIRSILFREILIQ